LETESLYYHFHKFRICNMLTFETVPGWLEIVRTPGWSTGTANDGRSLYSPVMCRRLSFGILKRGTLIIILPSTCSHLYPTQNE
jgi:hypothetical protein